MGVPEVSFCKLIQSGFITAENLYMASFNCGAKSRLHSMANALTSTGLPGVISCLIKYLCPQVLLVPAMLEHLWCPMGLASGRVQPVSSHKTPSLEELFDLMVHYNGLKFLIIDEQGPTFPFFSELCKLCGSSSCAQTLP